MKILKLSCLFVWILIIGLSMKLVELANSQPIKVNEEIIVEEVPEVIEEEEVVEEVPEVEKLVSSASQKYSVPKEVIYAIIATESNKYGTKDITQENILEVDELATSKCDCVGLMQISKYALADYNKYNNTNYELEELYDIEKNIEVGTWYFSQFNKIASTWAEQYVIYNVGYGEFSKINEKQFVGWDGNYYSEYRNKFFYLNDMFPPTDDEHGLMGENKLPSYNAKKRFETCLKIFLTS